MSPASSLYNLFVPKPQPPPYNKISKLVMKVETETVQIRNVPGGPPLDPEKNYPHYPVLERTLETVGGDGAVLTSETTTMSPKSWGSSWYNSSYASSSASSEVDDEDDAPSWQWRPRSERQSGSPSSSEVSSNNTPSLWRWRSKQNKEPKPPSFSPSAKSSALYRRSGSVSSFSSLGSFSSGSASLSCPGSETETRIAGVVKSNEQVKMVKGDGIVLEEDLEDVTSTESWPEPVRKLAGPERNNAVIHAPGPPYAGWTMKKNKFTRREQFRPNYRAIHLAELEEKRRQEGLMDA
jgi:hypothetical protein